MAKKRRKVFRRQADRSWKELKPKPKKPHKPTRKQIDQGFEQLVKEREHLRLLLRPLIREATRAGLTEAVEHCGNFWSVSDGYKKYINYQIESQAEALLAAVRTALREELERHANLARRDTIDRAYERARRKK